MKVTVIKQYTDKYTGEKHYPGEVLSVSAERMVELASRSVIDKIPVPEEPAKEEPVPVKEEAPKKTTKKRVTRKKG